MKLPDIQAWLASARDFKQGVALYAALGTSATYQRLFALGATPDRHAVLVRELNSLVDTGPPEVAPVVVPAPPVPSADLQLLVDVRQQLKAVRDERSHLHPQLTAKNLGKKARLVLALRIVALTGQEVTLKAQEAYVQQHGRLPGPVATADVTDEAELRRRLLNLRSRRSKAKNQPEKLAALEAEMTLIQSKLKS